MRSWLLSAAVLACACAGGGEYLISPALRAFPDTRVAVLPFENNSAEPAAPGVMRGLAAEGLGLRGYPAVTPAAVDAALRKLRRTGGAQSAAEAGRELGAALLCYGAVEDFAFENLGLAVRKSVRLRLKIVSAATGETLYEGAGGGRDIRSFPDQAAAKSYYMEQGSLGGGEAPAPALRREIRAALSEVLDRLPRR